VRRLSTGPQWSREMRLGGQEQSSLRAWTHRSWPAIWSSSQADNRTTHGQARGSMYQGPVLSAGMPTASPSAGTPVPLVNSWACRAVEGMRELRGVRRGGGACRAVEGMRELRGMRRRRGSLPCSGGNARAQGDEKEAGDLHTPSGPGGLATATPRSTRTAADLSCRSSSEPVAEEFACRWGLLVRGV